MKIDFVFACRDDCLHMMEPKDLRTLVRERDNLAYQVQRMRALAGRSMYARPNQEPFMNCLHALKEIEKGCPIPDIEFKNMQECKAYEDPIPHNNPEAQDLKLTTENEGHKHA
jgi:hypothetical protein